VEAPEFSLDSCSERQKSYVKSPIIDPSVGIDELAAKAEMFGGTQFRSTKEVSLTKR